MCMTLLSHRSQNDKESLICLMHCHSPMTNQLHTSKSFSPAKFYLVSFELNFSGGVILREIAMFRDDGVPDVNHKVCGF